METHLLAVFADVIAPLQMTGGFVNSVEVSSTGTDEEQFAYDRRRGEQSTAGLILPAKFWYSRRGKACAALIGCLSATQ